MKKKILIFTLLLVLLCSLTGCRALGKAVGKLMKGNEETTEEESVRSEKPSEDWDYPEPDTEPEDSEVVPVERPTIDGDAIIYYTDYEYGNNWDDTTYETHSYYSLEWVVVEPGENYSALASAVNSEVADYITSELEYYNQLKDDADSMFAEGWLYGPLFIETKASVSRADSSVFSFLNIYSDYTGGAHGYYARGGYNYDSQTGKKLEWRDFFNLTDAEMEDLLIQKLEEDYKDEMDMFFDYKTLIHDEVTNYTDGNGSEYKLNFYVDNCGVTFLFNPYELAAFAAGTQDLFFSYDEYGYLMDPRYTTLPGSFCIPFALGTYEPLEYDVTGDGQRDTLTVNGIDSMGYGDYDSAEITINGNKQTIDCWGWEINPLLVVRPEGNQLILRVTAENDWKTNMVFAIENDGSVSKLNSFDGNISNMLNPDYFPYNRHFDILSTYNAYAPAKMDARGNVQILADLYRIDRSFSIVSKVDLELPSLVESGGADSGSNVVIPAGSEFYFEYTNGTDTVYFNVEGYGPVRITLEENPDNWAGTINGKNAEDCFEQLYFAG